MRADEPLDSPRTGGHSKPQVRGHSKRASGSRAFQMRLGFAGIPKVPRVRGHSKRASGSGAFWIGLGFGGILDLPRIGHEIAHERSAIDWADSSVRDYVNER